MDKQLKDVTKEYISKLVFNDYTIEKINFISNPDFDFDKPIDIEFKLATQITYSENINKAKIRIKCIIFDDAKAKGLPFTLKIEISGDFSYEGDITDEGFKKFCKINGTAALFPYLRSAITNITGTTNYPPLVLPLVNINDFEQQSTKVI